jgi:hypothetical protein
MGDEMAESAKQKNELFKQLRKEIASIRLVDAHEHLPDEEKWISGEVSPSASLGNRLSMETDFSALLGYAIGDLVSAGMPKDAVLPGMTWEEKWRGMQPFWRHVRNLGPGRLCRQVLSEFFDVDDLSEATIPEINSKLPEYRKPGIYKKLFKDSYGFEVAANVVETVTDNSSNECLAPLLYTSNYSLIQTRDDIARLEKDAGRDIYSLNTYVQALDMLIENAIDLGLIGIKWHKLSYLRDIHYPATDAATAEACLNRIFKMPAVGGTAYNTAVGFDEMKPFQNFIQHHLIRRAIDLDLAVQVHTGTLGGSHGAHINHTNPTHLVNLFLQYPQARFDLLHAGYPYMQELAALVKLFPNIYINMAWFDLLSPLAAINYLQEWLSSVPTNKIFAFGADQKTILHACINAEQVRDNVAEAITREIISGAISEEEAILMADDLLRINAWHYFKMEKRWANRNKYSN